MDWQKTVQDAANLMDQKHPGWYKKIDTTRLNMNDPDTCIVGQLTQGHFGIGMMAMGFTREQIHTIPSHSFSGELRHQPTGALVQAFGFDWLTHDLWLHEIALRLALDPKVPVPTEPEATPEPEPELVEVG